MHQERERRRPSRQQGCPLLQHRHRDGHQGGAEDGRVRPLLHPAHHRQDAGGGARIHAAEGAHRRAHPAREQDAHRQRPRKRDRSRHRNRYGQLPYLSGTVGGHRQGDPHPHQLQDAAHERVQRGGEPGHRPQLCPSAYKGDLRRSHRKTGGAGGGSRGVRARQPHFSRDGGRLLYGVQRPQDVRQDRLGHRRGHPLHQRTLHEPQRSDRHRGRGGGRALFARDRLRLRLQKRLDALFGRI